MALPGMPSDNPFARLRERVNQLERELAELRSTTRALGATTIDKGDLRVQGGGNVLIGDGGNLEIAGGGRITSLDPELHQLTMISTVGVFTYDLEADDTTVKSAAALGAGTVLLANYEIGALARIVIDPATGALALDPGNGRINLGHTTTSAAANARLDPSNGLLQRSSSSRRYKQDIAAAEIDPAEALALVGRTWRDRAEVAADPDTQKRFVGFIAEELDEHETLRQFVDYDDEGRPDAIQYDRLSVALLAVVKAQQARLDGIEARLSALEAGADS